ncbi:hypothetical protein AK830_g3727 [Neonectria ditissima]|uniref:Uncharacterized protein n=1 Tax=Neonectria ditissima TaxID=78410 RepID=A0A0P7BPS4_9HYPO|nr:hypothetical protein AK830_g3727 [Neonectria ditissima]
MIPSARNLYQVRQTKGNAKSCKMELPVQSNPACGSSPGMPFIVSSNVQKVDPATRKLIRSHVMRGKKQPRARPDKGQHITNRAVSGKRTEAARVKLEEVIEMYRPQIPSRVGSDTSCITVADGIEPSMFANIAKVSPVATRIMFPLLGAIGFQADNQSWLYLVMLDAAALHITAFAIEEFMDRVLRRQSNVANPAAMLHFNKGLTLLRERLLGGNDEAKVSDSTIGVVVKLASAAHFNGDYEAAKRHMEGLRKMVELRGGIEALQGKQLFVEILRCDLGIALLNSSSPLFFHHPSEPVPPYSENMFSNFNDKMALQDDLKLIGNLSVDLVAAWRVMRRFCLVVNLGTQTQRLIRPEIVHETMTAVIYRLINMGVATGVFDETIRQGLLAFSHHVFLQWQDIKLPYHRFPATYKSCVLQLRAANGGSPQLMLWLLMTGAVSVFPLSEQGWFQQCLREYAELCEVRTWKKMQEVLKSFLWIALLDEEPGKRIYDSLYAD